jgi:hypothetical protein
MATRKSAQISPITDALPSSSPPPELLAQKVDPKLKELVSGGQLLYREALTTVVRKWQKRGDIPAQAKPADVAKVILSLFLGFIVQSAMIGGIDPDTAAKGFEGIISSHPALRG